MKKESVAVLIVLFFAVSGLLVMKAQLSQKPISTLAPSSTPAVVPFATYQGMLPCADCSGLDTKLVLYTSGINKNSGTFQLLETYTGKNDHPFVTSGSWAVVKGNKQNPQASIYQLTDTSSNVTYYLQVNPQSVQMLDQQKNVIKSPFKMILTKQ